MHGGLHTCCSSCKLGMQQAVCMAVSVSDRIASVCMTEAVSVWIATFLDSDSVIP